MQTASGALEYAHDKLGPFTFDEAKQACAAYRGGGFSDWRLPTKDELNALRDAVNDLFDHHKLTETWSDWYWSGEEVQEGGGGKWWVQRFDYGNQFAYPKTQKFYARPIRSI